MPGHGKVGAGGFPVVKDDEGLFEVLGTALALDQGFKHSSVIQRGLLQALRLVTELQIEFPGLAGEAGGGMGLGEACKGRAAGLERPLGEAGLLLLLQAVHFPPGSGHHGIVDANGVVQVLRSAQANNQGRARWAVNIQLEPSRGVAAVRRGCRKRITRVVE